MVGSQETTNKGFMGKHKNTAQKGGKNQTKQNKKTIVHKIPA
jgi:hypothetical protein